MLPFTFLRIKDTIKDTVMYTIKDTKNRFLSIFDTILDIIAHSIIELYAIQSLIPVTSNGFIMKAVPFADY